MNEIEDLLRRYRPAGPPDGHRARTLSAIETGWPSPLMYWLAPVGLAAAAVVFSVMADRIHNDLVGELFAVDPESEAFIDTLAAPLGGDATARAAVRWLVEAQEQLERESKSPVLLENPGD